MKTDKYIGTLIAIAFSIAVQAQNVGINNTGTAPNSSAQLDLNTGNAFGSGTSKGLLIPNVPLASTTDAVTVPSPATSLLVYNTANAGSYPTNVSPGYYYNSGTPASPVWTRFAATNGSTSFPYENRFQTSGSNCGTMSNYYYLNSSNYGPGTYGDNTNPYRNYYSSGYYTTTPASVPAYFGVWYVSWTATQATTFIGYNGWGMVEATPVGNNISSGAATVTVYFYKYTPTNGNTGNIAGTLIASGSTVMTKGFTPYAITFSPGSPVALSPGDIIIGYCTTTGCPNNGSTYSIIDIMGSIQFQ